MTTPARDFELDMLRAALTKAHALLDAQAWQPIATAPTDGEALFWVVPKTAEEAYGDTSGVPIVAESLTPRLMLGFYGQWSSLEKALWWMPLPTTPEETP
jgi:hypothetical protein